MKRFLLSAFLLLTILVGGVIWWETRDLPPIEKTLDEGIQPSKGTQIFGQDGTVILSAGKYRHNNVKLKAVSPHFVEALIATEDRRFYDHFGVDIIALARAIARDIKHRKLLEGGSTLTQQLARNVFLTNERSFSRKVKEAALAVQLEQKLSKDEILELYVNNIYFGEGAYGIQAASEIYFNKRPESLTIDEAALIAGLPQAPSFYSPFHNPEKALERRNEVLENMVEAHKLSSDEFERLKKRALHLNPLGPELASGNRAPFFNQYVMNQVMKQFDLDEQTFWQSDLKIYTTLDVHAQGLAARAVRNQSAVYGRKGAKQQAALLSLNPKTGSILAYVGGKDYSVSQFDRVTQALRSPGSLFKVFTYTTAMERGYEPTRVYLDEAVSFGDWHPQNYDKQHHGYMTLAKALATSNNVVAVKLMNELTPPAVIDVAHRMGLNANLENNLTITLGSNGATLLDMTSAFGVLANQGVRAEPYAIEKIVDRNNQTLYQHQLMQSSILSRPAVDTMVSIMMGVVRFGTGRAADIGRPVAGKTGTSDEHRDSWFVGFTPEVITGVWVGNDDNTPMPGMTGGGLPAVIWRTYMRSYLNNRLITYFDVSQSRALTDSDFTSYKIENLSDSETYNPDAISKSENTETQGGLLEADPAAPQPVSPENRQEDSVSNPQGPQNEDSGFGTNNSPGNNSLGNNAPVPVRLPKRQPEIIPLPPPKLAEPRE